MYMYMHVFVLYNEHVVPLCIIAGDTMDVFDAAERYRNDGRSLIVLAGKDYGSGSSRDWAAKGPWMLVRVCVCVWGGGGGGGEGCTFNSILSFQYM